MEHQTVINMQFTKEGLNLLTTGVERVLETWPGGDPEEQEALISLRNICRSAQLEFLLDL